MESSFRVTPILKTPNINKGDEIKIDLFISGYGNVNECKLHVQYSHPELINEDHPGKVEYSIRDVGNEVVSGREHLYSIEGEHMSPVGFTSLLPDGFFADDPTITSSTKMSRIMAERSHDGYPPVSLTLNTKEDVPPGNYAISVTITFEEESEIKQHQKEVVVHINNIREKHMDKIEIIAVISGVAVVMNYLGYNIPNLLDNILRNKTILVFIVSGLLLSHLYLQATAGRSSR